MEEFGQASADYQVEPALRTRHGPSRVDSLPLTIAILIVAFGALVAAGLPVMLAFSAVLAATGLNSLVSHLVPTDAADARRDHPDDRDGGRDRLLALLPAAGARGAPYAAVRSHEALLVAARTSGQAVLISGATVLIAMAGMFVAGQLPVHDDRARHDDRRPGGDGRLADGAAGGRCHRLGDKVDWGRVPFFGRGSRDDGPWARFIAAVLRRPLDGDARLGRARC